MGWAGEEERAPRGSARARRGAGVRTLVGPDPSSIGHSLPIHGPGLLGRDVDVEAVLSACGRAPVVTITGVGGIGKTALANEVGYRRLADMADGVWWVDLGSLRDPGLVLSATAASVGVEEEPHRLLAETLAEALRYRHLLIVLDNCEHVLGSVQALVDRLVRQCAGLGILATSREPLGVPGETVHILSGLAVDGPDGNETGPGPAVRLFVRRAREVRPEFVLDEGNSRAVADICRRLDGIPLAIELAAARSKLMSPTELLTRLDDRFGLLSQAQGRIPRHQTLRAVFDWSYELLDERERRLFDRLGAFWGGFSLDAAEAVCGGSPLSPTEVIDILGRLVDKSLVSVGDRAGRTRFWRMDTVRIYARERLSASDEESAVRRRHAAWYLSLARSAAASTAAGHHGHRGEPEGPDALDVEWDNFRSAISWALDADPIMALELAVAVHRGHLTEVRDWLTAALAQGRDAEDSVRGPALEALAWVATVQGDYATARAALEACLELWGRVGDHTGVARVEVRLGTLSRYEGRTSEAERWLASGLERQRHSGDMAAVGSTLAELGQLAALRDDRDSARFLYRESLNLSRQFGDEASAARALVLLGELSSRIGELGEAFSHYEQALDIHRRLGDRRGLALTLTSLGRLARLRDDLDQARDYQRQALELYDALSDLRGRAAALSNLGFVAYLSHEHELAEQLFSQAVTIRRRLGDQRGLAVALVGVANGVFLRREPLPDLEGARALCEEALEIQKAIGDQMGAAWTNYILAELERDLGLRDASRDHAEASVELGARAGGDRYTGHGYYSLAALDRIEGNIERAATSAAKALDRAVGLGAGLQMVRCIELVASVCAGGGDATTSAQLYGAAEAAREHLHLRPFIRAAERRLVADDLARVRQILGTARFERAWTTGRGLALAEAAVAASRAVGVPGLGAGERGTATGGSLEVRLLGDFSFSGPQTGAPTTGTSLADQVVKILALLGPLHIDELVEHLWPEAPPGVGRRRVHNVLTRVRRTYGEIVSRRGEMLAVSAEVRVDTREFEELANKALAVAGRPGGADPVVVERLLAEAMILYKGELLPADRFQEWSVTRRERLAQLALRCVDALARSAEARGDLAGAVSWLERAAELDPLDESVYLRAAALLAHMGDRVAARSMTARARSLARDLAIPPSQRLVVLENALND